MFFNEPGSMDYSNYFSVSRDDTEGVSVTGDVILPYGAPVRFPTGSCLTMFIQKNIQCYDCDNPKLTEYKVNNPKINDRRIPFKMILTKPEKGGYIIEAVLNKGWCKNTREWIRYEDYHNEYSFEFELKDGQLGAQMDVDIVKYQSQTSKAVKGIVIIIILTLE